MKKQMTFNEWGERWLSTKHNKVSATQQKNLRCYLANAERYIGFQEISSLTPFDIDSMLDGLTENNPNTGRPASHQTLCNVRSTVTRVFDYALDFEAVHRNPARGREISRYAPKAYRRALTQPEQQLIVDTPHKMRIGALIMMLAGLRRGELVPLRWDNVDFNALQIRVVESVGSTGRNQFNLKAGTKTSWGRVVDIPIDLAIALQDAKEAAVSPFVCPAPRGAMLTLTSWRRLWKGYMTTLINAAGEGATHIGEITAHYLRHTYATLLYASGVDVLTAAKLMGHSNVKTTISIYTHLDDLTAVKSVSKLDNYVSSSLFGQHSFR